MLVAAMPETFLCLALYLAVLVMRKGFRFSGADSKTRVLLLCTAVIALNLLAVLKQPEPRYTVPAVAFLCLGNAIAARILLEKTAAPVLAGVLAGLLALFGLWRMDGRLNALAAERAPAAALVQKISASGCYLMPFYSVNMASFDLFFGDAFGGFQFKDRLARLYPDFMTFDGNHHVFPTFTGDLKPQQAAARLAGYKCVYWIGSPLERYEDFGMPKDQFSLVARSAGNIHQAVAVYAPKPGWQNSLPQ